VRQCPFHAIPMLVQGFHLLPLRFSVCVSKTIGIQFGL
jgi:hypothetical protein